MIVEHARSPAGTKWPETSDFAALKQYGCQFLSIHAKHASFNPRKFIVSFSQYGDDGGCHKLGRQMGYCMQSIP